MPTTRKARGLRRLSVRSRTILGWTLILSSGIYPIIASRFDMQGGLTLAFPLLIVASVIAGIVVMPKTVEQKRHQLERKGYLRTSVVGTKNPWAQILGGALALILASVFAGPIAVAFLDEGLPPFRGWGGVFSMAFLAVPLFYVVLSLLAIARGVANLDVGRLMRDGPAMEGDGLVGEAPDPGSVAAAPEQQTPFRLEIISALPKRVEPASLASRASNVYGHPPIRLLFLWNFDAGLQQKRWWLRRERWFGLGPIHMLTTADRIPLPRYLRLRLTGRLREAFVADEAAVERRLAEFDERPLPPGWRNGRLGRYPALELLCVSSSWRNAVRRLCAHVDAVVLDARGYTERSPGLSWELGAVSNWVPRDRCIILTDITTEMPRLERELRSAWEALTPASPNHGSILPVRVINTAGDDIEGSLAQGESEIVHAAYDASQVLPYLTARHDSSAGQS